MKIKEFFKMTKKILHVEAPNIDESKKKRLKELLRKLEEHKEHIKKRLKDKDLDKDKRAELEDELEVYIAQINRGQKILEEKKAKSESKVD